MRKEKRQHDILSMKDEISKKLEINKGAISMDKSEVEKEVTRWNPR
jgi:hypothetical protein